MVKINNALLLFFCVFILFSCSGFVNLYREDFSKGYYEGSTDFGPIVYNVIILRTQNENHDICFSLSNINDVLKDVRENYIDDAMLSMYIDEFRIVLPSGEIIDLLDGKIDITYHYNGSEKITGMLYKKVKNVKPQNIDSVKRLFFDGIKNDDGISVYFHTKIPSSFDSILIEYTLSIEWENRGTVKRHNILTFNKEIHEWYFFTT